MIIEDLADGIKQLQLQKKEIKEFIEHTEI